MGTVTSLLEQGRHRQKWRPGRKMQAARLPGSHIEASLTGVGVAKIDTLCGGRVRHDRAIETVKCRRAGSPKTAAES
jgi:hypothetical protein